MNAFDFKVKAMDGTEVELSQYAGKALLIVNSATGCGFTPQYEELEGMYEEFKDQGFEILDFPCNQFGNQAPGSDGEIHEFCTLKFGTKFPQFSKIDVNGDNADPLYKWLTANTKFKGFSGPARLVLTPIVKKMDRDFKNNGNIKWNFTKFLINRNGEIVERYEPTDKIADIKAKIQEVL
ncbi:MAG: glutathione peroxidase [Bacillota bacterium]|nr:glutathione peroxidase [Bacillota bacterium]